eukprot:CAMPEP_0181462982 /NCGR_PEP_ID=MMETSP1110-20121109/34680_1 /TAXON_ID=174948 /ORGANISM="Symbiodinium sp., Strain CCMP421" /LENGTH=156 /DNA_ID=CAMNT_0023587667 /DNA_START=378 /DNA_END=849 /DNA_ORIENTATION=-
MAPVQAPVPGNGTPTNAATPTHRSWAPIGSVFCAARFSSGDSNCFICSILSAASISGIGIMLPRIHSNITCGTANPIQRPTGTPPRSSTSGKAEIIMRMAQSGKKNKSSSWSPGESQGEAWLQRQRPSHWKLQQTRCKVRAEFRLWSVPNALEALQ